MQIGKILLGVLWLLQINSLYGCDIVPFKTVKSMVQMEGVPKYELYGYPSPGYTPESFRFDFLSTCQSLAYEMSQTGGLYDYIWDNSKFSYHRGDCVICNITSNQTSQITQTTTSITSVSKTTTKTLTTIPHTSTVSNTLATSIPTMGPTSTPLQTLGLTQTMPTQTKTVTHTSTLTSDKPSTTRTTSLSTYTSTIDNVLAVSLEAKETRSNIPIVIALCIVCVIMVIATILLCKRKKHGEIIFETHYEEPVCREKQGNSDLRIIPNTLYTTNNEINNAYDSSPIYATIDKDVDTNIIGAYDNVILDENGIMLNETVTDFTILETCN